MRKFSSFRPSIFGACFALSSLAFAPAAYAGGGGGGFAGATEPTQIANNIELVASYAEQVTQTATTINQYMTMLDNLQQLPAAAIAGIAQKLGFQSGEALRRIATSLGKVQQSAGSVMGVYNNAQNSVYRLQQTGNQFANMTVADYARYMAMMAQTRGGAYKAQYEQTVSKLKQLEDDAKENQQLITDSSNVTGNVQGLQQLSRMQGSAIMALQQQRADLLSMHAEKLQHEQIEQDRKKIEDDYNRRAFERTADMFKPVPIKVQ